jgi:hypothetical protein
MAQYKPLDEVQLFWDDRTAEWSEALNSPSTANIEQVLDYTQWQLE